MIEPDDSDRFDKVPSDYSGYAWLSLLFCCFPLSIAAIYQSNKVVILFLLKIKRNILTFKLDLMFRTLLQDIMRFVLIPVLDDLLNFIFLRIA